MSNVKGLRLSLVFSFVNGTMYFLASLAVVVIITFNTQAEHGSVIVGTIETLTTDVHMVHCVHCLCTVIVSEIIKTVVIKSYFAKQTTASYKEVVDNQLPNSVFHMPTS